VTLLVSWLLLMWLAYVLRVRCKAFLETQKRKDAVGTKWEQIAPMEECFDFYEYEEDDL
jgi:hypothetical protein